MNDLVITKSDMMLDPDCYQGAKALCGLTVGDALQLVKFNRMLSLKIYGARSRFKFDDNVNLIKIQHGLQDEVDAMQELIKEYV